MTGVVLYHTVGFPSNNVLSLLLLSKCLSMKLIYCEHVHTYFNTKIHSDKGNYYVMMNAHRPQHHNYYPSVKIL